MAANRNYINQRNTRRGQRRFKRGVFFAAAVLCVAVGAFAVFASKPGSSKTVPSSQPLKQSSTAAVKRSHANSSSPKVPVKTTDRIPVLMYHSVNFDPKMPNNILRVPKDDFAAEMKWLSDNGYKTLSLDELYSAVNGGTQVPEKSVVLTFDDGYADNYENAFPIIKQYHFKAITFMITSQIGNSKDGYLTADQIKKMDEGGMDVECHTVSHLKLDTLSYKRQYSELKNSKSALEALLGHPIYYLAYPFGEYNSDTVKIAELLGYRLCFKENGGIMTLGQNRYELARTFVGKDLNDFISRVEGTADYSK